MTLLPLAAVGAVPAAAAPACPCGATQKFWSVRPCRFCRTRQRPRDRRERGFSL